MYILFNKLTLLEQVDSLKFPVLFFAILFNSIMKPSLSLFRGLSNLSNYSFVRPYLRETGIAIVMFIEIML